MYNTGGDGKMNTLSEYKDFLLENKVLTTAAGITFGQASLQLIKSFVADLVLPFIYMLISSITALVGKGYSNTLSSQRGGGKVAAVAVPKPGFLAKVLVHKEIMFANFLAEVVTYILMLISAYFFITYLFRSYFLNNATKPSAPPAGSAAPPTDSADEQQQQEQSANIIIDGFVVRQQQWI